MIFLLNTLSLSSTNEISTLWREVVEKNMNLYTCWFIFNIGYGKSGWSGINVHSWGIMLCKKPKWWFSKKKAWKSLYNLSVIGFMSLWPFAVPNFKSTGSQQLQNIFTKMVILVMTVE